MGVDKFKLDSNVNESVYSDKILDNKKIILTINKIIEKEIKPILSVSTFSEGKLSYTPDELIDGDDIFENGHDIFLSFHVPYEDRISTEEIKKRLDFPFDLNVYMVRKKEEYHVNQYYVLSYNIDEMLKTDFVRSLKGIDKFNI